MSYVGSQFSKENINPALLDNSGSQHFERDVEIATETPVNDVPVDQQLRICATSFTDTLQTLRHTLNPEATSFQPLPLHESQRPDPQFHMVSNRRQRPNQQTPGWRENIAVRQSSYPIRPTTPLNSRWRSNNPYAQLSCERTEPESYYQNPQSYMGQWTAQRGSNRMELYPIPPDTGGYSGFAVANGFNGQVHYPAAFRPGYNLQPASTGHDGTTLSYTNVSTLPTSITPSENLAQWNRESYNAGDRTRYESLAPPATPTPSNRNRRRGSAATSLSVNVLACEACGMSFEKTHELNHHRRCHGKRSHICSICNKSFVFPKDLRRHMTTHKKEERHLFCNIIGCKYNHKGFGRKDHLKRHFEKRHPGNLLSPPATSSFDSG